MKYLTAWVTVLFSDDKNMKLIREIIRNKVPNINRVASLVIKDLKSFFHFLLYLSHHRFCQYSAHNHSIQLV